MKGTNIFVIFKSSTIISILGFCLTLFSCNNSFTILNRKYRPGYSFSFNKSKDKLYEKIELEKSKPMTDSIVDEIESETFSCSNTKEPIIIKFKPKEIFFVCDTPPKKDAIDPWSLYKPMEPKSKQHNEKHLEPFNIVSILLIILTIALGGIVGVWGVAFLLLIFILNIISLIRIKRNPKKFRKISKILAWILLGILVIPLLFILILLFASTYF
jgi:hypothetical protein